MRLFIATVAFALATITSATPTNGEGEANNEGYAPAAGSGPQIPQPDSQIEGYAPAAGSGPIVSPSAPEIPGAYPAVAPAPVPAVQAARPRPPPSMPYSLFASYYPRDCLAMLRFAKYVWSTRKGGLILPDIPGNTKSIKAYGSTPEEALNSCLSLQISPGGNNLSFKTIGIVVPDDWEEKRRLTWEEKQRLNISAYDSYICNIMGGNFHEDLMVAAPNATISTHIYTLADDLRPSSNIVGNAPDYLIEGKRHLYRSQGIFKKLRNSPGHMVQGTKPIYYSRTHTLDDALQFCASEYKLQMPFRERVFNLIVRERVYECIIAEIFDSLDNTIEQDPEANLASFFYTESHDGIPKETTTAPENTNDTYPHEEPEDKKGSGAPGGKEGREGPDDYEEREGRAGACPANCAIQK